MAAPAIENRTSERGHPRVSALSGAIEKASTLDGASLFWWKSFADAMMQSASQLIKLQRPEATSASSETDAVDENDIEPPTSLDRLLHAWFARSTAGISPASLGLAYADWALHFAISPGKWQRLAEKAARKSVRLVNYMNAASSGCPQCIVPLSQDRRFSGEEWQKWPFNVIYQSFLLQQQWWHNATTGLGGVSKHHEQVVAFMARQLLDTISPVNFIATNPEVLDVTIREGGRNLVRGAENFRDDWQRAIAGRPPVGTEAFRPGKEVAITPGQVVYRNRLIELIQYTPTTQNVYAEPLLIVPAWIMKYYILDLSPSNSLVRYLVGRGHTVFMISWHNPGVEDRDLGMDDYLRLGALDALEAIRTIVPDRKVNALGYCLGGTLLSIAAAYLAREQKDWLKSVTLLAGQTDFTEPGELALFIDESQLDFLEDIMWDQGFLDTKQMAGAFQLLRSNDLVWSRVLNDYLLGRRQPMTDLMAWNADATRLPYRMHSEYLRQLFLGNDLFEGRYKVDGRPIVLSDIRVPMFVVATERDHVAPWRSVYKINLLSDTDIDFLLTSGGHNVGIISEPGHLDRHYRVSHRGAGDAYVDPDLWREETSEQQGSWWAAWSQWLEARCSGRVPPPPMGTPAKKYPRLEAAPGRYIFER
jgi:poly[(R)-3-hydroxyalkanoate] polymerase subunit PhaC